MGSTKTVNVGERMEKLKISRCKLEYKLKQQIRKTVCQDLLKLNISIPYYLAIPLSSICSSKLVHLFLKVMYKNIHVPL